MSGFTVETESLRLEIDPADPLSIRTVVHSPSGREIARDAPQRFLVRMPKRVSDPYFLTDVVASGVVDGGLAFVLADGDRLFRLTCRISSGAHGVAWEIDLEAPEPLWMLEWEIGDLALRRVVVPALGGQLLEDPMPAGMSVAYKYPVWWQAQFAIGELDDELGVWLRTMEVDPRLKVLRVRRTADDRFALGLGIEAEGPLDDTSLAAAWYLDGYGESWREPVNVHRSWMRSAFGALPFSEHPHFPSWAGDINFMLEIWGMGKEQPEPRHTFDDMIERVRAFAHHHDPSRTLLYLPGFAEEGIDSNAPDYGPAPKCGGRDGFKKLTDAAHELGYRIMIHTNVLALAYSHPLYERFKQYQVVDCFGRPQGWGNDIDGDWLHEPYFAYVNPGHAEWGDHMRSVFRDLIGAFHLDGIFLDQTLLAFNVGRGPNFVRGMREHVRRLQQDFPQVLFAGEGFHEQVVGALPMAQIHGIDSIAGVHGMEGARAWRRVHPVSAELFAPFTRLTAHLLTKHPDAPVFERQEAAYRDLGVIPALVLYDKAQPIDVPPLHAMLERATSLDKTSVTSTP